MNEDVNMGHLEHMAGVLATIVFSELYLQRRTSHMSKISFMKHAYNTRNQFFKTDEVICMPL
jgi:hypothetical protein